MLSRGYTGTMPDLDDLHPTRRQWLVGMALPALALVVCLTAWVVQQ
jgi:cobalt/nickel transport system permease protein